MNMFAELLAKHGLTREQLSPSELVTLQNWAASIPKPLSAADILEHVNAMAEACENELADPPKTLTDWLFRKHRQIHLVARLKNYVMLRDFISKPDRARAFVEEQLKRVVPQQGASK